MESVSEKNALKAPALPEVIGELAELLIPIVDAINKEALFSKQWSKEKRWY